MVAVLFLSLLRLQALGCRTLHRGVDVCVLLFGCGVLCMREVDYSSDHQLSDDEGELGRCRGSLSPPFSLSRPFFLSPVTPPPIRPPHRSRRAIWPKSLDTTIQYGSFGRSFERRQGSRGGGKKVERVRARARTARQRSRRPGGRPAKEKNRPIDQFPPRFQTAPRAAAGCS